ncbi:MAG: hypothetical protein DRI69_04715 [Bacteroidetes bacterium]|nr:MAG: hypothetical protein DRI69_04715 [Bacteroidota bacterium]
MALFNFFHTPQPQRYRYIPRFYDPDKEELEARIEQAKPGGPDDFSPEAVKVRMKAGFKRGHTIDRKFKRKLRRRANRRVILIGVALALISMYLIWANLDAILNLAK